MDAAILAKVNAWLNGNFDQETKDTIKRLQAGDPKELEEAFYRNLEFGTGGLRGIMGTGTNRMNKYTVGMATNEMFTDYLGTEDFDGTLAYKLKVTQKDGDEFTYWLDPDTFLEIKVDETRKIRGAEQTTETELGDYEKVAGVYFPMSVESWTQGQPNQRQRTIIASGTANTSLAADYFAEPQTPVPTARAAAQPDVGNTKKGEAPPPKPAATKPASPSHPGKGE